MPYDSNRGRPDFPAQRPFKFDWPPGAPTIPDPTASANIVDGGVTNAKLANGIDPRKISGSGIKVYLAGNQTITDSTVTQVDYDTTLFVQGFIDITAAATQDHITAPYAGVYLITAYAEWGSNNLGERNSRIRVNGATVESDNRPASNESRSTVTAVKRLAAGDTVGHEVRQSSGANRALTGGTSDNTSLSVIFLFSI